ncbi:MAG: Spo0B domain-containing protein [Treponema sp.]|nr:Spo0B domain-containing protein [Treponema sp.]
MSNTKDTKRGSLNSIRREIQRTHLILIVVITILLSVGGAMININANAQALDQSLLNTADLISRIYSFNKGMPREQLKSYFNSICRELPDIDVISIVDSHNIRVYHTNNALIGMYYEGAVPNFPRKSMDTHSVFHAVDETGPSGPQRRSYSPIYDENGEYTGFIMTIILKTSIRSVTAKTVMLFIAVTIAAILIEIFISTTFSRRIKQKLLGYEPDTFSAMFTVRDNILESIQDGIMAVDADRNIQFINKTAKKILGYSEDEIAQLNDRLSAQKFIVDAMSSGESVLGMREKTDDGTELLIDCIPVKQEDGRINGVVTILHDRTEYTKLMEDLSGTKYLVDSMRANNHDFTNKLHVILGLIQIGEYDKAVSYIENISIIQRETLSRVMHSVDNPSFAALLIGKIARASECNVRFILKDGIRFKSSDVQLPSEALVTIVGNLIDNALDAMNMQLTLDGDFSSMIRELTFGVFSKPGELLISVRDRGCGIPDDIKEKIFDNGFSTKGKGRGVGLYHTRQLIESLGGSISFESQTGVGTCFMVDFRQLGFPKKTQEDV